MSRETKVILIISIIFLAIFAGFIYFATRPNTLGSSQSGTDQLTSDQETLLVRKDSYQTSPNAKVVIVEFGDFQCPACGQVYPTLKEILKTYKDQVNLVFRNFPLPQHSKSAIAAYAALAAGNQGKFWEMYDKLYENQDKWSDSNNALDIFVGFAKDIGLDVDKFSQDIKEEKGKEIIASDQNDATLLGVNATPTFFIDGKKIVGSLDLNELKALIDQKLSQTSSNSN